VSGDGGSKDITNGLCADEEGCGLVDVFETYDDLCQLVQYMITIQ
jgi:hypothetical protein